MDEIRLPLPDTRHYANGVQLKATRFDLVLNFFRRWDEDANSVEALTSITMSWEHARDFASLLQEALSAQESDQFASGSEGGASGR